MSNRRDGEDRRTPARRQFLQAVAGVGIAAVSGIAGAGRVAAQGGDHVWRFGTGDMVQSSPTVVGGTVYVGCNDQKVYALDADTGDQDWHFETDGAVTSTPAVGDGTVYVGSADNAVYALDASTGEKQWQFETGGSVTSSPTVVDGTVFIGGEDSSVYALEAGSGEERWAFETGNSVESSPTVVNGTVFVGSNDARVYALDAGTGEELWQYQTGPESDSDVKSSPTVVDGTVYVGEHGFNRGAVYALNAWTGEERWTTDTDGQILASPTVVDGTVFIGENGFGSNDVFALNADTGEEVWRFDTDNSSQSSPTVAGGTVFVGSKADGRMYALDADTGEERWNNSHGKYQNVRSSPTVVDGTVYYGSSTNAVHALDAGIDGASEGSRVMLGTLGHRNERADTVRTTGPAWVDVAIADTNAPVEVGETLAVTVEVTNVGDETAEGSVDVGIKGFESVSQSIELPSGNSEATTVAIDTAEVDGGEYTVNAYTGDDSDSTTVTVTEPATTGTADAGSDTEHTRSTSTAAGGSGDDSASGSGSIPERNDSSLVDTILGLAVIGTVLGLAGGGILYTRSIIGEDGPGDSPGRTSTTDDDPPDPRRAATSSDNGDRAPPDPDPDPESESESESEEVPPMGGPAWTFRTAGSVHSSPTVVDGAVYVGSRDGNVYVFDAETGDERWRFDTDGEVSSSPTVVDGGVFVGSGDGAVYGLNVETKEGDVGEWDLAEQQYRRRQRWRFETGDAVWSSPTVANGTVYAGSDDGNLYAIDAESSDREWTFSEPAGAVRSSPTVADGTVFVGADDGTLYAVNATTGRQKWAFTRPDDSVRSSPTVALGTVFVGADDGTLYAVDDTTGRQTWAFTRPSGDLFASPTIADGTVYAGSEGGSVYALDASDGSPVWEFDADAAVRSSPTVADGTVVVGADDGCVYALGADDGELRSRFETGAAVRSSPTVVDGTVYVGSHDDLVYALDPGLDGSSDGSRVALCTLGHHDSWTGETTASAPPSFEVEIVDTAAPEAPGGDIDVTVGVANVGGQTGTQTVELTVETIGSATRSLTVESHGATTKTLSIGTERGDAGVHSVRAETDDDVATATIELEATVDDRDHTARSRSAGRVPETIPTAPELSIEYADVDADDLLGSGGNADVYRATVSTGDGKVPLAVKEPRIAGTLHTEAADRLLEEADTWQKLDDHDHVVGIVDFGAEPMPWIAMEYMDAGHLGERAGDLGVDQALWTAIATTKAVRHAHDRGVAHLDLKPENVLFRSVEDAWDVPKVADWGLSKRLLDHSKSVEGMSPQYAAPEQFDTDEYGDVDHLTDIYQLGTVFYELVTGRPPFEGRTFEVINKIQTEEPAPPSDVADVPPKLDEILLTALSTEKADRYEHVLYLRDELQACWSCCVE